MMVKAYQQVLALLEGLKGGTEQIFNNDRNQTESTILEYKTSFPYDTTLGRCPHTAKNKETLLNVALARIL